MKYAKNVAAVACLFVVSLSGAEAATLTTTAETKGGTPSLCSNTGTDSASCEGLTTFGKVAASAGASYGALRGTAFAVGGVDSSGTRVLTTATASASFSDTLFFGVTEGYFEITVDLLGTIDLEIGGTDPDAAYILGGSARATLRSGSATSSALESLSMTSPETVTFKSVTGPDDTYTARFGFSGGTASLAGSLSVTATCNNVSATLGKSVSCRAESRYGSSMRLIGAKIFDLEGNLLSGVSLTSESGFDYLTGVEPHDRITAPIPVPASLPLLAIGLGALGMMVRRYVVHNAKN